MLGFRSTGFLTRVLTVSDLIPLPPVKAFGFFEDPRNLCDITPRWLNFRMMAPGKSVVSEGAEFDYVIRWLGVRFRWKSRITDYLPPWRFRDIQVMGPYRQWDHLHTFSLHEAGTLMHDRITFRLPLAAAPLEPLIRRQLTDIFCYRARRIGQWAAGTLKPRASGDILKD